MILTIIGFLAAVAILICLVILLVFGLTVLFWLAHDVFLPVLRDWSAD